MMTGVGRPQFSAVLECAAEARELGRHVWADGGVRHPRDVALALAAGASNVMIGSWFAGTYESPGRPPARRRRPARTRRASAWPRRARCSSRTADDVGLRPGPQGAVRGGHLHLADVPRPGPPGRRGPDRRDRRGRPQRLHLRRRRAPSRSSHERAVVGVQSAAGYAEGMPLHASWMSTPRGPAALRRAPVMSARARPPRDRPGGAGRPARPVEITGGVCATTGPTPARRVGDPPRAAALPATLASPAGPYRNEHHASMNSEVLGGPDSAADVRVSRPARSAATSRWSSPRIRLSSGHAVAPRPARLPRPRTAPAWHRLLAPIGAGPDMSAYRIPVPRSDVDAPRSRRPISLLPAPPLPSSGSDPRVPSSLLPPPSSVTSARSPASAPLRRNPYDRPRPPRARSLPPLLSPPPVPGPRRATRSVVASAAAFISLPTTPHRTPSDPARARVAMIPCPPPRCATISSFCAKFLHYGHGRPP